MIYFTDKAEKQQAYSTVVFNDPDLVDRLYNSGCKFGKIQDEKDSWVSQFILFVLQIAVFVAIGQMLSRMLMKKMGGGGLGNAMQFGKSNAKVYVASETGIKFHDVAGEDEAKEQLQEIVDSVSYTHLAGSRDGDRKDQRKSGSRKTYYPSQRTVSA